MNNSFYESSSLFQLKQRKNRRTLFSPNNTQLHVFIFLSYFGDVNFYDIIIIYIDYNYINMGPRPTVAFEFVQILNQMTQFYTLLENRMLLRKFGPNKFFFSETKMMKPL